jgi:hypothetical protein
MPAQFDQRSTPLFGAGDVNAGEPNGALSHTVTNLSACSFDPTRLQLPCQFRLAVCALVSPGRLTAVDCEIMCIHVTQLRNHRRNRNRVRWRCRRSTDMMSGYPTRLRRSESRESRRSATGADVPTDRVTAVNVYTQSTWHLRADRRGIEYVRTLMRATPTQSNHLPRKMRSSVSYSAMNFCRELDHPRELSRRRPGGRWCTTRAEGCGHLHRLKQSGSTLTIPFVVEAALSMNIG